MAQQLVCTACGTKGVPRRTTPGSFLIELFLWCCFLVPGLIYSLWRLSSRKAVCSACGGAQLVPPDSPVGRRLMAGLGLVVTFLAGCNMPFKYHVFQATRCTGATQGAHQAPFSPRRRHAQPGARLHEARLACRCLWVPRNVAEKPRQRIADRGTDGLW